MQQMIRKEILKEFIIMVKLRIGRSKVVMYNYVAWYHIWLNDTFPSQISKMRAKVRGFGKFWKFFSEIWDFGIRKILKFFSGIWDFGIWKFWNFFSFRPNFHVFPRILPQNPTQGRLNHASVPISGSLYKHDIWLNDPEF